MRGAILLALLAVPAEADGIAGLCAGWGHPRPVCDCAAERLAAELPMDDFALYHRVGWDVGQGLGWDEAVEAEIARSGAEPARTRRRAGIARRTHRAMIGFCG